MMTKNRKAESDFIYFLNTSEENKNIIRLLTGFLKTTDIS